MRDEKLKSSQYNSRMQYRPDREDSLLHKIWSMFHNNICIQLWRVENVQKVNKLTFIYEMFDIDFTPIFQVTVHNHDSENDIIAATRIYQLIA